MVINMLQLEIERPWLLISMLLLFLVLIGIFRYGGRDLRRAPVRSLVLHMLAGALLILALAGVSLRWMNNEIVTVYVADLSDSVKSRKEDIQEFIVKAIQEMPQSESAAIVTFGGDVSLEQFVSDKKVFRKFSSQPSGSATNLEEAVFAAMALYREDAAKRMVIVTDGHENAGDIEKTVSSVLANQVDLKVVMMDREATGEVYVDSLDIGEKISIGERFPVKVGITSNIATTAQVSLYCGRTLKTTQEVSLNPGDNSFLFWDVQNTGGFQTYRVVIEPEEDTETINNEYGAYTTIEAPPRILLVEGEGGKGELFCQLLDAAAADYKVVTPSGTPETINQLLEYRSVILLDVYGDDLKEGFMNGVESYVKDYAGGLIAIGGENSFALGNYKDTPLETVLPVYMDLRGEKEIPSIAFVMVIDQSGSMSEEKGVVSKLDLAKEAAIRASENLRSKDYIGVLSFSDSYTWVTKLTGAGDYEKVKEDITAIPLGGGTSIYPALEEAISALTHQEATLKHVLLLTDGQDTQRDYQKVLQEMEDYGITLSTVAVGAGADTSLLSSLAEQGNGRYYQTGADTNLPRIFAQEVFLSVRSYLVNREFTPILASGHEILSPVAEGMPPMYGYVASTKKETATGLLVSDEKDPILTIWQYGLGRTAAFNSDGVNKWTGQYAGWDGYVQLWKNIIDYTVSDTGMEGRHISVEEGEGQGTVRYETDDWDGDTVVTAIATDEEGSSFEIPLYPDSPGVYTGELAVTDPGVYSVNVRQQKRDEITAHLNTAYVLQYSQEYRFPENSNRFSSFLPMVHGTMIKEPEEVYMGDIVTMRTRKSLFLFLVLAALMVFLADILLRRLALNLNIGSRIGRIISHSREERQARQERRLAEQAEKAIDAQSLKKHLEKKDEGDRHKGYSHQILSQDEGKDTSGKSEDINRKPVPDMGSRPDKKPAGEGSSRNTTQELLRRKRERDGEGH